MSQASLRQILNQSTKQCTVIRNQAIVANDKNSIQLLERLKEKYDGIKAKIVMPSLVAGFGNKRLILKLK